MVYNVSMNVNTKKGKAAFQKAFLRKAGLNFTAVKAMMDFLPHVGFYIKDADDRIIAINRRNCEICALRDEFDAIGLRSSDLFPEPIRQACLARDQTTRKTNLPQKGVNYATVDRSLTPTVYSVFPLHDSQGRVIGTMCGFYDKVDMHDVSKPRTRLQPAMDLMNANDGHPISLSKLAKACKLSISHFRRLFRATFRETPAKYALRLRLNRARKALESSRDTVASIAFDTGFYDQSHLIKAFRSVYKMTPEKYRQRHIGIPTGRKHP